MLSHELLRPHGILILRPEGSLEATDFQRVAAEIDPYIEANGKLEGVMIDAASFPGWKDFAGLFAHLKFVKDHHRRIEKVAVVSDSSVLTLAPKFAGHFVQAEIRHFSHAQRQDAIQWLREARA
jgi:SpoIIAA-like